MYDKIKKGDVVQLRSGGPVMTVDDIESENGVETAYCSWFIGSKRQNDSFLVESLENPE